MLSFFVEGDLEEVCKGANEIRKCYKSNQGSLCTIINGKSGKCSEDCKFCAQSSHYKSVVESYAFLDADTILEDCQHKESKGVQRYSIVTAGRKLSKDDLNHACNVYNTLLKESSLPLCASHGLLTKEDLIKLKESGVTRYHMNLESSRDYFPNICSSHTYDEKIQVIRNAKRIGLEVCSGGIFGMGESWEDRFQMALELSNLKVDSIPINILTPIKGTPFEDKKALSEEEVLRIVAMFRWLNPKADIRLAAGRILLKNSGEQAFLAGANAAITGDMLTTSGNQIQDDIELMEKLDFKLS